MSFPGGCTCSMGIGTAQNIHQKLRKPHQGCLLRPSLFVGRDIYHGPSKPTCLEVFMVNNLVFKWPKPLFFMVLVAHGIYIIYIYIYILSG